MRICLCLLALLAATLNAAETLDGKLSVHPNAPATVETADHKTVTLDGDENTRKVLADTRLNGFQIQVKGHYTAPGKFLADPSHERSLLVHSDGKLKLVTYWCDVCSIRDYTPGPCRCCQKEYILDLRDPDQK